MGYRNESLKEPYVQQNTIFRQLMLGYPLIEDLVDQMEKASYSSLLEFKENFMQNLRFEWLIEGHLTEEMAKKLTDTKTFLEYQPLEK